MARFRAAAAGPGIIPWRRDLARLEEEGLIAVTRIPSEPGPDCLPRLVEAALRDSRMSATVLRCSFFMQNLHRAISTHGVDIVESGELFIPAGRGKTTFIDARDAAEVAATVAAAATASSALSLEERVRAEPLDVISFLSRGQRAVPRHEADRQ